MLRSSAALSLGMLSILFTVHCSSADAGAEADTAAVETGAITVKPFATLGTGIAGDGEEDINTPDGVIFNSRGLILATDAENHRVQVWDPLKQKKLGQFGSPEIFRGAVVDLAEDSTGRVIVTDEDAHVAYMFNPPTGKEKGDLAYTNYTFTGKDLWTDQEVQKVGGVTFDSKGRYYSVDAHQNLVRRYLPDGTLDPSFAFDKKGSTKYLQGCEGIAVDEKRGNLYVSSEFTSAIQVFNLEDGSYKGHMIGRANSPDAVGTPTGTSVFQAAVEGLWILDDYLLASDEADNGTGHVQIFDLTEETVFDTDADEYATMKKAGERSGYVGHFGTFCSPDSVTAYTDKTGESYVAVADQCHYQVVVYKWSEILKAGKISRP